MTQRDHYLMGRFSLARNSRTLPALRYLLAHYADCSPFEVHIDVKSVNRTQSALLCEVSLPRAARATEVADICALGRLSLIEDPEEQQRLLTETSRIWPSLGDLILNPVVQTMDFRVGEPTVYAFQFNTFDKQARIAPFDSIKSIPPHQRHTAQRSYHWAKDWLTSTLEHHGWRVLHAPLCTRPPGPQLVNHP